MTRSSTPRRGASNAVGVIALVLAIVALFFALCSDPMKPGFALRMPFGSGLSGYDFESAQGAYKSEMQAEINMDIRAMMELQRRMKDKDMKEKLESVNVDSEADFKSKKGDDEIEYKVLCVKFKNKGKDKKEVVSMRKDKDSGLWRHGFLSDFEVEGTNKELAKKMREWPSKEAGPGGAAGH